MVSKVWCVSFRATQDNPLDMERNYWINVNLYFYSTLKNACAWVVGGLVAKSCLTLAIPWTVACQAPSVHGILQARILEWLAISFSRGSSLPRNRTQISCIAGRWFANWAMRERTLYISIVIHIFNVKINNMQKSLQTTFFKVSILWLSHFVYILRKLWKKTFSKGINEMNGYI